MSLSSPREAAPGPGYWTVTDLDSRLTVNRGRLYVSGSSAAYDRTMLYLQTPFARAKGRYVEFGVTPDDAAHAMKLGWQNAASAAEANQEAGLLFDSDGFVKA